jgi:hypothetical protein
VVCEKLQLIWTIATLNPEATGVLTNAGLFYIFISTALLSA